MGKLQSKHAAAARKRRESPEGDSFVASAYASGRKGAEETERRARDKQELPNGNPKEGPFREDQCPLEVALPTEKAEGRERPGQQLSADDGERAANREGPRGRGGQRLNIDALQCDVSVEDDDRQEWTFTLYDFDNCGKVTREGLIHMCFWAKPAPPISAAVLPTQQGCPEGTGGTHRASQADPGCSEKTPVLVPEDMSSLMHTIYEVVDASVNHSSGSSKTLRVKLTVSPEPSSKRKEGPPAGQDREPNRCRTESELPEEPRVAGWHTRPSADPQPCSERGPYCVDENTERRNHYLDLAGIENYTSRFGPGSPPVQAKQEPQGRASHLQARSRSQEPDTHAVHHRRSQVLVEHVPSLEPAARALDPQPRPKGPEKQFLKSPKGSGKPPGVPASSKSGKAFSYYLPAVLSPQAPQDGHHLPQPPPQPPPPPYGHKRYRQRAGRATRHSRPHTPSLPQWSTRWCGTCRPRQRERATWCR
uniref:Protein naked cuticle homolog n=1 Tax=Macaca fascicularis TaxID=9541 RepID=A0A2K5WT32_MACFA